MLKGPTANLAVRRAIQLAFDYSGSLKEIHDGGGAIANGIVPSTLPCRPNLPTSSQNIGMAKSILKKAGIKHLTLTLDYQTYDPQMVSDATLLVSELKQMG